MDGHLNPLDTPTNHSSLLKVVIWILVAFSVFFFLARAATKLATTQRLALDDGFIVLAMGIAITQSICLTIAIDHGFAQNDQREDSDLVIQEKLMYTFSVLFFASLCFSILSVISLIRNLSPAIKHRRMALTTALSTVIWTLVAVLGSLFQCRIPQVWNSSSGQCINRIAFFTFLEIANIFLETMLIVQPVLIAWNLQIQRRQKLVVICSFLSRTVVVVALLAQLVVILDHGSDPFITFEFALTTSIVQYFSILAASTPYLRPFMENLQTGMMGNDDLRRRGHSVQSYGLSSIKSHFSSRTNDIVDTSAGRAEGRWQFDRLTMETQEIRSQE